jgi:hypothetical protein
VKRNLRVVATQKPAQRRVDAKPGHGVVTSRRPDDAVKLAFTKEDPGERRNHMLELSRLLDSNSREAIGQVITTAQRLLSALARFRDTGIVDDETLFCALWDLAEGLSICSGDLRKQLAVKDGEPDGLFCHWDDSTGMQIWRMLSAIKAAGEAVEQVAYRFSRAIEEADQPSGDVSETTD